VATTRKLVSKSFVTTREAARLLGVSLGTAQLWADRGLLSCWKTDGGHRRIPRESVERLLVTRIAGDHVFVADGSSGDRAAGRVSPRRPLRILVVEDEPTLLRLYRLQLAQWALQPEVTSAKNGFEALVHIGRLQPDLLIADLNLPEMDGFNMLRTLRNMPELDAMEIVVVTGLDSEEIALRGGLPKGIPVLFKPIPFPELEKIAELVATQELHTKSPM
jgi:excisionase family DNA binding protein